MPHYEPTAPRAFASPPLSISRSRSTQDVVPRPPALPDAGPESPPLQEILAETIKNLRDGGATDRGRQRNAASKSGSGSTGRLSPLWDDGGRIGVRGASGSVSTRTRVALWEDRSRSRSKGRNKSRQRRVGEGWRTSNVPAVPDIKVHISQPIRREFRDPEVVNRKSEAGENRPPSPPDSPASSRRSVGEDSVLESHDWSQFNNSPSPTEREPMTPTRTHPEVSDIPSPDLTPGSKLQVDNLDQGEGSPWHEPEFHSQQIWKDEVPTSDQRPSTPPPKPEHAGLPPTPDTMPPKTATVCSLDETAMGSSSPCLFGGDMPPAWNIGTHGEKMSIKEPIEASDEAETTSEELPSSSPFEPERGRRLTNDPTELVRDFPSQGPHNDKAPECAQPASVRGSPPGYDRPTPIKTPSEPPSTRDMPAKSPASTSEASPRHPHGRLPVGIGAATLSPLPPPEPVYRNANGRTWRAPSKPRSKSRGRTRPGPRPQMGPQRQPWDAPPVVERAIHAAAVGVMQGFSAPLGLYRDLRDYCYPPVSRPDIIKAYPMRPRLPVRIFFPSRFDTLSQAQLPVLFTIHGGGFTIGSASDDDVWNRNFANSFSTLVVALNYAKAPWAGFPVPLLDVEALYHAVLDDLSLPLDRHRMALAGFDAGANLALALAQLPSVRNGVSSHGAPHPYAQQPPHPPPRAAVSICGILDFAIASGAKTRTRPYKRQLRGMRGWGPGMDWMTRILPSSAWSYIPYGHDAMDPLLSPLYANRSDLPPHLFVVGAELDCLAHDSWRAACGWAGRPIPASSIAVGRRNPSRWRGALDDGTGENALKFAWEDNGNGRGGAGSTKWLLVPDVVHGFDCASWRAQYMWTDEPGRMDSEMKTFAYQRELAIWLWGTVWQEARPWR